MKLFKKVAIIGTGLIGGSMALAMKKKGLASQIVGVSRHKNTLGLAKRFRAIDKGSLDLGVIKGADLVILATPVNTILELAGKIRKLVPAECIVTDVGSTKREIVFRLSRAFPRYVGGHPLAGSEKRGIANIQADMFKDSLCILTPTGNTDPASLGKIKKLWARLGARVVFLSPETHDRILSFVSHLPHAVAFSLIGAVPGKYLGFGANGLKDTTRIALSESRLWADIFLSNRKNILRSVEIFEDNLRALKSAIGRKDLKALIRFLEKSKGKRENLK